MNVDTWKFLILFSVHFYMSETFHTKKFSHFNSVLEKWDIMPCPMIIEM